MKVIIYRILLIIVSLATGSVLFIAVLFAGDQSKGPLEDLFAKLNSFVSGFEKDIISSENDRANTLSWFKRYRDNVSLLNAPDTVFFGVFDDKTVNSYKTVVNLEDSLGFQLPLIQIYTAWGSKTDQNFPLLRAQAIYDLGSVPLITWEPWLDDFDPDEFPFVNKENNVNEGGLKAIADGLFDVYIDEWIEDARTFRHPFFLRFGHEMNDPYRYPWGPQNNSPEDFILAWKHLVHRFDSLGANNAIWVWSPHPAYPYFEYFPTGSVDWVGITALNYGTVAPWSQWWTFDDIFGKCYQQISPLNLPFMITEFSSLGVGGNRAEWYRQAIESIPLKYPLVHSVVFFHAENDNTTTYKSLDWTIKNDREVLDAINTGLKSWK